MNNRIEIWISHDGASRSILPLLGHNY